MYSITKLPKKYWKGVFMKFLSFWFLIGFLISNVSSKELNQATIIPYLDNLIQSESKIYDQEFKRGRFKLFPLYYKKFPNQEKYNPGVNFLVKNFNMVQKNKDLTDKFIQAVRMSNFHFGLYLYAKAMDSKQIDPRQLNILLYDVRNFQKVNELIARSSNYLRNPKTRNTDLSFREYFLIYNYTMAPRSHYIKEFNRSRFLRGQHINYIDLNRTRKRKEGLTWMVKVDTIKALKKLKPYEGRVYSGLKTNPRLDKMIMKNDILCFGGFLSTSNKKKIANEYRMKALSKYLFQIESKTGKDIKGMSKYRGESEILFYPYKKFKLINIYEEKTIGKLKIIHLEEIKDYKGPCKSLTKGKKVKPRDYFGD